MRGSIRLQAESVTDPGSRSVNGDTLLVHEGSTPLDRLHNGSIFVIADGVGADDAGQQAGRVAAETIVDAYRNSAIPDTMLRLRAALERSNAALYAQQASQTGPARTGGATALAAVTVGEMLVVAHVGRERAYLWRSGTLQRLTEDHSWVAEQVRLGRLSPEEAMSHPRRNVVIRALGVGPTVQVDVVAHTIQPNDRILLCSDGLHRALDDAQIARLMSLNGAGIGTTLVRAANEAGGPDNVSVVCIYASGVADDQSIALDRLALLNRLGRELSLSLDLDVTLSSVLEQLLTITGGDRAAILLRSEDGRLTASHSHNMHHAADDHSRSIAEEALRSGRPIVIAGQAGERSKSMVAFSLQSVLCVPMIVNEETLGVLYVDSATSTVSFDQNDLDLLIPFASQAAAAILNARLHEQVLRHTRELEQARREQHAIFRSLSSALIAIDESGTVTHWNPAAEQMFEISASTVVGSSLMTVLAPAVRLWLVSLITAANQGAGTILAPVQWEGQLGNRPRVVLVARVARIRDADERPCGVVIIVNDRTDIMLAEEARNAESVERQRLRTLLNRYLAPSVVEHVLESGADIKLGGSRKEISVLFADVRGFTGFSSNHDPEDVVAMLNQYLDLATAEIFGQRGTLDKFIGDAVMGVFGAPVKLENHALAAIRAAVSMCDRLDELRRTTKVDVGFGIGINTGDAIVGNIGTPELMSYTAIGDAVNVAARLQSEARSGEILISEATFRAACDHVNAEPLGPIYVKGIRAPISTYKVLGLRDATTPAHGVDSRT